jgi:hypothetical protein
MRGTEEYVPGHMMGGLDAQTPAPAYGNTQDPLVQFAITSLQNGSLAVPHSHVRPLSEHGAPIVGGLLGQRAAGDPLLLPLVLPPELPPEPDPLLLPLPLPLDPLPLLLLLLLLLLLPELEPPASPASPPVKVAPPQPAATSKTTTANFEGIMRSHRSAFRAGSVPALTPCNLVI